MTTKAAIEKRLGETIIRGWVFDGAGRSIYGWASIRPCKLRWEGRTLLEIERRLDKKSVERELRRIKADEGPCGIAVDTGYDYVRIYDDHYVRIYDDQEAGHYDAMRAVAALSKLPDNACVASRDAVWEALRGTEVTP